MHGVGTAALFSLAALCSSAAGFSTRSSQSLARQPRSNARSNPHSVCPGTSTSTSTTLTIPRHCSTAAFALHSSGNLELSAREARRRGGKAPGLQIPVLYALASAALIYRSQRATHLADTSILLASAALSLFNLSSADRKRFIAANKASANSFGIGTISTTEEVDVAEKKRFAAQRFTSAFVVKTLGQILGIIRMMVDKAPSGGAALFMATQIIYFAIGGGKYRHTDDGQLDPIEERLVVGASVTYAIFALAALASGQLASGSLGKGIAIFVYCFGCLTGAFDGLMSLFFGGRKAGRKPSGA